MFVQIHTEQINALCGQNVEFLGASAKLRKAIKSFDLFGCPSFRPCVRVE